eukprot:4727460-Prorocentrum_lima.AAC.1
MGTALGPVVVAVARTDSCTQTCEGGSGGTSSMWGGGCCEGALLAYQILSRIEGTSLNPPGP